MNETIVVTGATGNVGADLVRLLTPTPHGVRAAVLDVAAAQEHLGPGVAHIVCFSLQGVERNPVVPHHRLDDA